MYNRHNHDRDNRHNHDRVDLDQHVTICNKQHGNTNVDYSRVWLRRPDRKQKGSKRVSD
jgi:hypothetical protein